MEQMLKEAGMPALRQQFDNDFARFAFQRIDDKQRIVGKFGSIAQLDGGVFDVHFVGPNSEPLTPRKITAIRQRWLRKERLHVLDGEAWAQGRGRDFVLLAASLAGVKRKRRVTDEMRKTLQRAREAKAA